MLREGVFASKSVVPMVNVIPPFGKHFTQGNSMVTVLSCNSPWYYPGFEGGGFNAEQGVRGFVGLFNLWTIHRLEYDHGHTLLVY